MAAILISKTLVKLVFCHNSKIGDRNLKDTDSHLPWPRWRSFTWLETRSLGNPKGTSLQLWVSITTMNNPQALSTMVKIKSRPCINQHNLGRTRVLTIVTHPQRSETEEGFSPVGTVTWEVEGTLTRTSINIGTNKAASAKPQACQTVITQFNMTKIQAWLNSVLASPRIHFQEEQKHQARAVHWTKLETTIYRWGRPTTLTRTCKMLVQDLNFSKAGWAKEAEETWNLT